MALAGGLAYADSTDTIGGQIDGSAICTLAISSSDLSVTAPTAAGPSSTAFTNSPITMELTDNDVNTVTGNILTAEITTSLPDEYGTGNTYYIEFEAGTYTAEGDGDFAAGEVSASAVDLTGSAQAVLAFGTASGNILHATFSQPANLVINSDKRVIGSTSEALTIQYTFVDN
jgi:hypothetical protein